MQEMKSGGVAIVLSFLWTGLGQLYAGRIRRGLIMMLLSPFFAVVSLWGGGLSLLGGLAGVVGAAGGDKSAGAVGGALGVVGLLLLPALIIWWVWGIIDARRVCESWNRGLTATR